MSINRSELNAAIPQPAMERLPLYLNYLKMRLAEGCEQISSAMIAQDLRLTGIQVRKDLAYVSSGRPRTGRNVAALIACLEEALGYRREKRVVLAGAGRLGQALMSYDGFAHCGFRMVAAFDADEHRIGMAINGCLVYPSESIAAQTKSVGADYGIIAVPAAQAQAVCDRLVEGGVRAILCFAPVNLNVPRRVVVRNMDIAASLLLLSNSLTQAEIEREDDEYE